MPMNETYRNAIATHGRTLITHIGLVNNVGTELTGGSYARLPVTWTTATNGVIRPNADLTFEIPAGANVSGWRGFNALTSGTNYGGEALTRED
jgi:hypothetical protein